VENLKNGRVFNSRLKRKRRRRGKKKKKKKLTSCTQNTPMKGIENLFIELNVTLDDIWQELHR